MNNPWSGRFKKTMAESMRFFSQSITFDYLLAEVDIRASMAYARMLGECGIIAEKEARRLRRALAEILEEFCGEALPLQMELEDIHMNVEARLYEKVGDLAGKLHTGRSRNDQVATDMRMFFREKTMAVCAALEELAGSLVDQAEKNLSAVMPGFTHTRKAQPVLFSHHLLAYVEMFLRDRERFLDGFRRTDICPLGSGALAGTTFPVDREMVARELGFSRLSQNSIDAVSDRDFLLEFAAAAAITMVHLSRLMEELIWWGLPELLFVELPEEFCTGSSMMPNKLNPDAAELIRGKTGRVTGALVSLLLVMKGTPLAYNRDFQEDKEGMFDLLQNLLSSLSIAAALVAGLKVHPERMREAAATGFLLATDLADYLATKGLPFREAHQAVGKMVRYCEEKNRRLEDLSLSEMKTFSPCFQEDVREWLSLEAALNRRNLPGGTAPAQVKKQIARLRALFAEFNRPPGPSAKGKKRAEKGPAEKKR